LRLATNPYTLTSQDGFKPYPDDLSELWLNYKGPPLV